MFYLIYYDSYNSWICKILFQVKWARENYHHDAANPYTLQLASADASGTIILWDVVQGEVKAEFSDGNKTIQGHDFFCSIEYKWKSNSSVQTMASYMTLGTNIPGKMDAVFHSWQRIWLRCFSYLMYCRQ